MTPEPAPGRDVDGRLMVRIADGDEVAFMTLYDRHADALFGTVVRFVGDRELAAEVVQDAFLAVWQRARQYRAPAGSVLGWIMGIARNRAIDRLRAERRRPRPVYAWAADPDESNTVDVLDWAARRVADDPPEPVELLERRWAGAIVRTTLGEMPPDEQEVLVQAYDAGLTQAEIADHLHLPIGTVKSRTRRALARLRARLEDVPDLRPGGSVAGTTRGSTGHGTRP